MLFRFCFSTTANLAAENSCKPQTYFNKAYSLYPDIPKGTLEAVAFTNTRFITAVDAESCSGMPRHGVMGLILDGKLFFKQPYSNFEALIITKMI